MMVEREQWARVLRTILDEAATIMRQLGIAESAVGISGAVSDGAAVSAEVRLERLAATVRGANELAGRVGEMPLTVPGEKPVVDLRPWWSRVLEMLSATARRNTAGQQLETLRLEADAALLRAFAPGPAAAAAPATPLH